MSVSRKPHQLTISSPQDNSDYGVLGLSLLHDMAGPVTAAILDIERLNNNLKQLYSTVKQAQKVAYYGNKISKFQLDYELQKIINSLQKTKPSRVSINLNIPPNIFIKGDRQKFKLIITNLLSNSLEAYDKRDKNPKPIIIKAKQNDQHLVISIRDHGKGIPAGQRHRIVDPTYSTKSGPHLGLGLSLASYIISHDFYGAITFRRVVGRGARCDILVGRPALIYN